jgi:hypothetical protein
MDLGTDSALDQVVFIFILFFGSTWGLMLARQVLYHLSHSASPQGVLDISLHHPGPLYHWCVVPKALGP